MGRPKKILGLTLLLAGLVLCGFGLWLLLSPAQYRATTRINLASNLNGIGSSSSDPSVYDPYFIQTEFEVMQSGLVLSNVISTLHLEEVWGKKYNGGKPLAFSNTLHLLKQRMEIRPIRNTRLVEIHFRSEDPKEAADVANAIASAYKNYRMEKWRQEAQTGIQALEEASRKDQKAIEAKLDELDKLRKQLNVPKPEPPGELLKSNYPSYFKAKQEAQNMMDLHKLLQVKITSEKVDVQIPKSSLVQIVDLARPPKLPNGPNRYLGAALSVIGLFMVAGGYFCLKSVVR